MATNTSKYGFKKPEENDFYSVQDQNRNWDLADSTIAKIDNDVNYQTSKKYTAAYGLTLTAIRCGRVVQIQVSGSPVNIPQGSTTLMTIDSEYRPSTYLGWDMYVTQGVKASNFLFRVDANGDVVIHPPVEALSEWVNLRYVYCV